MYTHMYYATRIPMLLVYEVYITQVMQDFYHQQENQDKAAGLRFWCERRASMRTTPLCSPRSGSRAYACIHIYTYIVTCIHSQVYIHIHMYIYVCTHTFMDICTDVIYIYIYV